MVIETHLIKWQKIKAEIANCSDIAVMSKINYSLDAIRKWAKQSRQSLETQNEIAEYRLRLNRKQGEWIEANISEEGGKSPLPTENSRLSQPTLVEAGINYNDSPKFRALARLPEEVFESHIVEVKSSGEELTSAEFYNLAKDNKPFVAQNTGNTEWYTPQIYLTAARQVMGSIDTDPASSDKANEIVKATTYFTEEDDGRQHKWIGNVWLNPPYAQPLVAQFCRFLTEKYKNNGIIQACVLVNNATETGYYQDMLKECSAVCFVKGRVKFVDKKGEPSGAPLQGQTILYFGKERARFKEFFQEFGVVLYDARANTQ